MIDHYPYRIPEDMQRLQAIKPSDRARFDVYQRRLFVAYQLRPGDHVAWKKRLSGSEYREYGSGLVDLVLRDTHGQPVFAVGEEAVGVWDIDVPAGDREGGLWFLMVGDEVEALIAGQWTRTKIAKVNGGRSFPDYRVEGSQKRFWPTQDLRLPVGVLEGAG